MKDTKEILTCPACGASMAKIKMEPENVHLDVCSKGCGGIFFDNREIEKFDEVAEDISEILNEYREKSFIQPTLDDSTDRVCPACGGNFIKHFVSIKKEIQIDDCYSCGGKFLDYCELEKMRSQYNSTEERVKDVVDCVYKTGEAEFKQVNKDYEEGVANRSALANIFRGIFG